uniref:Uncharacterized protein n=1 Tax=Trichobilharzia regenti TaxID=157069 RepID=A0AA85J0G6_TRIRE|nr:unnamed protein product [Trichobilharzia regenti]
MDIWGGDLKELLNSTKKGPVDSGKSYLKRQLQGVLVVPKQQQQRTEAKIAKIDSVSSSDSVVSSSKDTSNSLVSNPLKNDKSETSVATDKHTSCTNDNDVQMCSSLPGMVYSDHSDSD